MSSFQIWWLLHVSKKLARGNKELKKQNILKRLSWDNI